MPVRVIPGRTAMVALAAIATAVLVALVIGMAVSVASWVTAAALAALVLAAAWDYVSSRQAWRRASVSMTRQLPAAFAIGVKRPVHLTIEMEGTTAWRCELHDHADATLVTDQMPLQLTLVGGTRIDATYAVTPTSRGKVTFAPADVRVRSRWGLCELLEQLGGDDSRRVYPDFAQVARYAWLAGDRRLQ
jgi:uncharacterized protein (DUF58 family)